MNTVKIEPLPTDHYRAVLEDGSTITMHANQLGDWLREHPMQDKKPESWFSRLFPQRKE